MRMGGRTVFLELSAGNIHISDTPIFQVGESDVCKFPGLWFGSDKSDVPILKVRCSDQCKFPVLRRISDYPTLKPDIPTSVKSQQQGVYQMSVSRDRI